MAKRLEKGSESQRRKKIIRTSRSADASFLPQLLARLRSNETYNNRRHIIRALGEVGGEEVESTLLELLQSEQGVILGDIAAALGGLGARPALPILAGSCDHELEWVRQNARSAIRRLRNAR